MAADVSNQLPRTLRAVRAARRRALMAMLVRHTGLGLTAGATIGVVLVSVARLFTLTEGVGWLWVLGTSVAAGAAAGCVKAVSRRWSVVRAASEIDRALGLHDRLGSALLLVRQPGEDAAFVALAVRDAEQAAGGVVATRVARARFGPVWVAWPALIAGAVAAGLFLPPLGSAGTGAARLGAQSAQRAAAAQEISSAIETAELAAADGALADLATPRELERLEQLHEELISGRKDPDEARTQAARSLSDLASELESRAQEDLAEADRIRDELADVEPSEDELAGRLAEALARDDVPSAREAVQELAERGLTEQDRERVESELRRLAEKVDQATGQERPSPSAARDEALEQGISEEQLDRIGNATDEEEIARSLQEQGLDPETSNRLAEKLAQDNRRQRAEERARERIDDLTRSLRETADQVRDRTLPEPEQPTEQPPAPAPQEQPASPTPTGEPEQRASEGEPREPEAQGRDQRTEPGQGQNQQRGAEPGEGQEEQQGAKPGEGQGRQEVPEQGQGRDQRQGAEPGEDQGQRQQEGAKPGEGQGQQPGAQPTGGQDQREGGEPGEDQGRDQGTEPGQGQQEGAKPREGQGRERGAEPGGGQDQQPGAEPGEGQGGERGLRRLERVLKEMSELKDQAQERQLRARRLQEHAQELMENATPDDIEQLRRWAGGAGDEAAPPTQRQVEPMPFETEEVWAPQEPTGDGQRTERVIAEWYGDGRAADGSAPAPDVGEELRDAAKGAERAIEQQRVPARYRDLVRRVFRRMAEQAERGPTEDAKDADGG